MLHLCSEDASCCYFSTANICLDTRSISHFLSFTHFARCKHYISHLLLNSLIVVLHSVFPLFISTLQMAVVWIILASGDYFFSFNWEEWAPTCTGNTSGCSYFICRDSILLIIMITVTNLLTDKGAPCLAFYLSVLCRYKTSRSYCHDNHSHCYPNSRGYSKSDQPSYFKYL